MNTTIPLVLSDSPQQQHSSLSEPAHGESPYTQTDPLRSHGSIHVSLSAPKLSNFLKTLAARHSSDSDLTSSDKLSALPDSSPLTRARVVSRMDRQGIQSSQSAPSLEGLISHSVIPSIADHDMSKATVSEGSSRNGSPFQRVSFESSSSRVPSRVPSPPSHNSRSGNNIHHPLLRDGGPPPSRAPLIDSAMSRMRRTSDPAHPPSIFRLGSQTPRKASYDAPSTPQSRATSPIRMLWSGFRRRETHEEPFIPTNPFQGRNPLRRFSVRSPEPRIPENFDPNCEDAFKSWLPPPITCTPFKTSRRFFRSFHFFLLDTLPRQIYLHFLLRLPSLYFSRIARVYEDSELSRPDIQRLVDACGPQSRRFTSSPIPPGAHYHPQLPLADEWTTANVSPALVRFKNSWEVFIDSVIKEWKTLNLVSALLLSYVFAVASRLLLNIPPTAPSCPCSKIPKCLRI